MIRYEDIDPEDMARYWGEGSVFLCHSGSWNAYTVTKIDNITVSLSLSDHIWKAGNPPKNVTLTYGEFFEQAMLHRPPLGVLVREDGRVYGLGWQHANGNELAKAIRRTDVYVKPLGDVVVDVEEVDWSDLFVQTIGEVRREALATPDGTTIRGIMRRNDYLRPIQEYREHPMMQAMEAGQDPEGQHPESIRMVLEFLNQTPKRIRQVIDDVKGRAVFLAGTAWLDGRGTDTRLMNGEHEVGCVNVRTGEFVPTSRSVSRRLVGEHVYNSLM